MAHGFDESNPPYVRNTGLHSPKALGLRCEHSEYARTAFRTAPETAYHDRRYYFTRYIRKCSSAKFQASAVAFSSCFGLLGFANA